MLKYGKLQDIRYEVWNGKPMIKDPSSTNHENVLSTWRVYMSNTGLYLEPGSHNFVMPDATFVSHSRRSIVKPNGIWGAPDLVVEVVSPGIRNTRRDTLDKFQLYEQSGVTEYWLVDYIERNIHFYHLSEGRYVLNNQSILLSGIHLPEDQIFEAVDGYI